MLYIKPNQIKCKEWEFVRKFLKSSFFEDINKNPKYEISLLEEPYTGFGYADLVCVVWDKDLLEKWTTERDNLKTQDVKILHHLYNSRVFKEREDISIELGFSKKSIEDSLIRLLSADVLIENKYGKVKIKPLKEIFFVKEIIAIEAKLKDWKRALEQSTNNTFFSSKSYTLLPSELISKNLIEKYKSTDVGIISFDERYSIIKKPKINKIPTTLCSWFFNEYIGREFCYQQ